MTITPARSYLSEVLKERGKSVKKAEIGCKTEEGIFPTFFMAGFECSTFIWKDNDRKDYVVVTGHDRHLERDYNSAMDLGIGVVREAIRWPTVDLGNGEYNWSSLDPILKAANECHMTPIWDMCHYGFPDGCDPFSEDCHRRFANYCRAAAERIAQYGGKPPHFFTPINEIPFFSAAATDMGWMYPFAKGRHDDFKQNMCKMAILGANAIRDVIKDARMVHVDPIIHAVAPPDRPDLADEAWDHAYREAYEAWDMLFGKLHPELGGSPEVLDIVGVNVYNFSQAQMNADKSRNVLGPRDLRRRPLNELLQFAWDRYHRPVIIGETSGYQDKRAEWLRMTVEESMIALNLGVNLQGICLYPFIDIPDWQTQEWAKIGIYDIEDSDSCDRIPCEPYIEELRRWQKLLDQPENVEPDAYGSQWGRVQLAEIRKYAEEWKSKSSELQQ
jgi:beta-glucosidase/6-phospho-beta-glucosidase/beta-galactosidase